MADLSAATAPGFVFVGERLWLDFVNTDDERRGRRVDLLVDFAAWTRWLEQAGVLDVERAIALRRRAEQQPAGATAALVDGRRVRAALRLLAERGTAQERSRDAALGELNRVLARSVGTRRVEAARDGRFTRSFVPGGDAFGGLLLAIVESAADSLVAGDLPRVRRCSGAGCARVFLDETRNGSRRWCDMASCGNRAKAARHRARDGPARAGISSRRGRRAP
jgi:predicted RNA-binding Zn ribbon-like protein